MDVTDYISWSVDPGDGYYGVMWWARSGGYAWIKYAELMLNLIIGLNYADYIPDDYCRYFIGCILGWYPVKPVTSDDRILPFTPFSEYEVCYR